MKKLLLAAACAASFATPAFAATNGPLSTTSSAGTVQFTTVIPNMVRISGLDDMTINITPAMLTEPYFSREDASDRFCVYSNDGVNGVYSLSVNATPSSVGGDTPFQLTGASGTLPYAIWTTDDPSNQFKSFRFNGSTVNYATTSGGQARPTDLDCGNVTDHTNAAIHVGVKDANILAATAGTYSDTITLTVTAI